MGQTEWRNNEPISQRRHKRGRNALRFMLQKDFRVSCPCWISLLWKQLHRTACQIRWHVSFSTENEVFPINYSKAHQPLTKMQLLTESAITQSEASIKPSKDYSLLQCRCSSCMFNKEQNYLCVWRSSWQSISVSGSITYIHDCASVARSAHPQSDMNPVSTVLAFTSKR